MPGPRKLAVYRETHAAAGMIPVNVLSEPALAVSEGHRPANSRPADPTREYEPGSGDSHDPAPVHRPHPPRSPPRCAVPGRQARIGGRPSGLKGALASRFARRPPAAPDPGASAAAVAGKAGRLWPAPAQVPARQGLPPAPRSPASWAGIRSARPADNQKKRTSKHKQGQQPAGKEQRLDRPFHMNMYVSACPRGCLVSGHRHGVSQDIGMGWPAACPDVESTPGHHRCHRRGA
jgi:hypothetical protein